MIERSTKVAPCHSERVNQSPDVLEARVPLPTLDAPDVGTVDSRTMGEIFLRQPALLSVAAKHGAEGLSHLRVPVHAGRVHP